MESLLVVLVENYFSVLRKYAVFTGRASRKEFWMFVLVNIVISIIFSILTRIPILRIIFWIVFILFSLAVLIPGIALGIRRLHDVNYSGWLILLCLIPVVNVIFIFLLCVIEGNQYDNQYGPTP
jgi:Predicted membrane protein